MGRGAGCRPNARRSWNAADSRQHSRGRASYGLPEREPRHIDTRGASAAFQRRVTGLALPPSRCARVHDADMYPLFVITVALAAVLTFSVQPLAGKMLLPLMGGTPAVWNTAMLFFQLMLLAGYLYAHLSVRWLGPRRQWLAHLFLLAAAALFLPVSLQAPGDSALVEWPALWVLVSLLMAIGLPFLVVTSTTPLIQRWLAATDHRHARDPYHLYAASNCGSVGALLAYPFLIEPQLALGSQSQAWLILYLLLGACLATGAWLMLRHSGPAVVDQAAEHPTTPPAALDRMRWIVYAFIPSSLLLSVTTVITTDLAPMPLLWVIPLSLYLLSHVHAFARRRPVATIWWFRVLALILAPVAMAQALGLYHPMGLMIAVHLALLIAAALAFHGRLADERPHPGHLTEFYVWLAVGGAAGGAFNALVAPLVFDRLLEYPLVLALAAGAIAVPLWRDRWVARSLVAGFVVGAALALTGLIGRYDPAPIAALAGALVTMVVIAALAWHVRRPLVAQVGAVGICIVATGIAGLGEPGEIHAARSFYGTHKVLAEDDGRYHVLIHGNTAHGAQERDRTGPPEALAYYHPSGPLGDIFAVARERNERADVAVVGLGTGSMAAYREPYQRMVIYEIDPEVERIAANPEWFTYLDQCGRGCEVRIQDGRLGLETEPEGRFGLLVLDAYSSAAIPVHLLTAEALDAFTRVLTDRGLIAFHVSSPFVDLAAHIAALSVPRDLVVRSRVHSVTDAAGSHDWVHESEWVVVARDEAALGAIADDPQWSRVEPLSGDVWRDDLAPLWQLYADS